MEAGGFRTRTTVSEGSKTNAVADTGVGGELGVKKVTQIKEMSV